MKTSIQAVIALVLVLLVVLGIYGASSSVFKDAGSSIKDDGDQTGGTMDCIFSNPEEADSKCRQNNNEDTSQDSEPSQSNTDDTNEGPTTNPFGGPGG